MGHGKLNYYKTGYINSIDLGEWYFYTQVWYFYTKINWKDQKALNASDQWLNICWVQGQFGLLMAHFSILVWK